MYLRSLLLEINCRDEREVKTGYSMHFLEKKVCLEVTVVFEQEREVSDVLSERARAVVGYGNRTRGSSVDEVRGDWVYVRGQASVEPESLCSRGCRVTACGVV